MRNSILSAEILSLPILLAMLTTSHVTAAEYHGKNAQFDIVNPAYGQILGGDSTGKTIK